MCRKISMTSKSSNSHQTDESASKHQYNKRNRLDISRLDKIEEESDLASFASRDKDQ